jgi:hypothetical protein
LHNACKFEQSVLSEFALLDAVEKGKRGLHHDMTEPGHDDRRLLWQAATNVLKGSLGLRSEIERTIEELEYMVKPHLDFFGRLL